MQFDADRFLEEYSNAFNRRDAARLCSLFALDDPRFAVFEEFSGDLLTGSLYGDVLSSVAEATGEMSFELLGSTVLGDCGECAIVHAIQKIVDPKAPEGFGEALIRVTLWIDLDRGSPEVLSGHFSSMMLCFPKGTVAIPWRKIREAGQESAADSSR